MNERKAPSPEHLPERLSTINRAASRIVNMIDDPALISNNNLQRMLNEVVTFPDTQDRLTKLIEFGVRKKEIVEKLQSKTLPRLRLIQENIEREIKGQASLPSTQEQARQLGLWRETRMVFESIIGSLPDGVLDDITYLLNGRIDVVRTELEELALTVVKFQDGTLTIPTAKDFLKSTDLEAKRNCAKQTIRALIASTIIQAGVIQPRSQSLKYSLGIELNKLSFFLGQSQGKEILTGALIDLPVTERTLIFRSMSTNIKQQLEYPDVEECSEEQMAQYIARAAYTDYRLGDRKGVTDRVPKDEVWDRLETLISSCDERFDQGFNVWKVINDLREHDYSPDMFKRIVEAGFFNEFLDTLERFFLQHSDTVRYAQRCRRLLTGQDEELEVPRWMKE